MSKIPPMPTLETAIAHLRGFYERATSGMDYGLLDPVVPFDTNDIAVLLAHLEKTKGVVEIRSFDLRHMKPKDTPDR